MIWDESLLFSISESGLERILRYILNTEVNIDQLRERLGKIQSKPLQSETMTLAEQFRQEGKLEGKREELFEGRLVALRASVLCALEIRHGACPDGVREVIHAVEDPKRLQDLLDGAIRSDSIEAFAQNL